MSLVEVSESTEIELKVGSTAANSIFFRAPGLRSASVKIKASMVAMFGWIMPEPLAIPAMWIGPSGVSMEAWATLATVSVVMIASAAA